MSFDERYTTDEKKADDPDGEANKTVLSNDAYAIGDVLETLRKKIEAIGARL